MVDFLETVDRGAYIVIAAKRRPVQVMGEGISEPLQVFIVDLEGSDLDDDLAHEGSDRVRISDGGVAHGAVEHDNAEDDGGHDEYLGVVMAVVGTPPAAMQMLEKQAPTLQKEKIQT